ncbi:MAG: hypothetical protein ABI199_01635 [Bacteroidia bacterium]
MKKTATLFLIISFCFLNGIAQVQIDAASPTQNTVKNHFGRKGRLSFCWGYNRAIYSKSDIHITGAGYNFKITNLAAHDEPAPFSTTYIQPTSFSVPQYNYRLEYFLNDNLFISIGQDHMKYRIYKQTTSLTGYINTDNNGSKNVGNYNNTEVIVGENDNTNTSLDFSNSNFLKDGFVSNFENCDGLNDVTAEIGRVMNLWVANNGKYAIAIMGMLGGGLEIVDTQAEILGYPSTHNYANGKKAYHLAGYSGSATFCFDFSFCKNFFLQARLKGGYINLPDINTTIEGGKASQHFEFLEPITMLGYSYAFGNKKESIKKEK